MHSIISLKNLYTEYIEKCKDNIEKHKKYALASRLWDDLLILSKIIITAISVLTLSVLTVSDYPNYVLAIVGGIFIFSNNILDGVDKSYNFSLLRYSHNMACDEYKKMLFIFRYDVSINDFSNFKISIEKFLELENKNHLQPVKNCFLGCVYKE